MNESSKPEKLRGGKASELTRLKKLWRDTLQEPAREYWRSLLYSDTTQADIRVELKSKLGINLLYDKQLTEFRDWEWEGQRRELEADRMTADEAALTEQHGEWSLDQVREEVLKKAYARSMATGDFQLGLATMTQDLSRETGKTMARQGDEKIEISRAKLKQKDKEIQLALRRVELLESKMAEAKEKLTAVVTKGGVTPETLKMIEEAAKLL